MNISFNRSISSKNMEQIIPNISSGKLKLIYSSSICFNPLNGLLISIPVKDANNPLITLNYLEFHFIFTYDAKTNPDYNTSIVGNSKIKIELNNFGDTLPAGIIKPIDVNYSGLNIKCYFFAQKLFNETEGGHLLNMTVSLFLENFGEQILKNNYYGKNKPVRLKRPFNDFI